MQDILIRAEVEKIMEDINEVWDVVEPMLKAIAEKKQGNFDIYVIAPRRKPVLVYRTETSKQANEWVKAREGIFTRFRFYIDNLITKEMARSFYEDCVGTINHGVRNRWSLDEDDIASKMGIDVDKATDYLWACAKYKITERQGGGWVI